MEDSTRPTILFHFAKIALLTLLLPAAAAAQGSADNIKSKRWTLSEWLEQKSRIQMMDMWLTMNSPSPYELVIGGHYLSTQNNENTESLQSYDGELQAFAGLAGVSFEHQNNTPLVRSQSAAALNLRLLGNSQQNSFFLLKLGQRSLSLAQNQEAILFRTAFADASLQMYITDHLGFLTGYRSYFAAEEGTSVYTNGSKVAADLYIEFIRLRISLGYFEERENFTLSDIKYEDINKGLRTGLYFYF